MKGKGYTPIDREWMTRALLLAEQAGAADEVPVGAVLVKDGVAIGEGWNRPISTCDPTAHAEVMALRDAASRLENYRLPETTLYVTIEPCTMCVGAILHARVGRIVYGATEPRAGAVESQLRLTDMTHYNHKVEVVGGVLAEECSQLISDFFRKKR
ncbi:MAG TPA: tRNA adenosine(34) deaminase TadA [Porticoccus sp.]|nr:tRNA adenosine(34) deaminase TadA [Porticoccus sp.]